MISADSDQVNAFTYEDVDMLEAIAAQVAGPIGSARLYREAQQLAEQVRRRKDRREVVIGREIRIAMRSDEENRHGSHLQDCHLAHQRPSGIYSCSFHVPCWAK